MTIYRDGVELEKVHLSDPLFQNSKEELHQLMVDKGFQLKSQEEIVALKDRLKIHWEEHRKEQLRVAKEFEEKAKKEEEERQFYLNAPSEMRQAYFEKMSKRTFKPIPPHYLELVRKLASKHGNDEL